ncbi:MAG: acetyl-coenzyme A synthetase N-terminal domain-containing protein, partial [Flavobacteriaceae bacterium]
MKDLAYRTADSYHQAKQLAPKNPEAFWAEIAKNFQWHTPWDKVLEYDFHAPEVKWFLGGKLNITENCLDRHLKTQPDQTAIIFEPNDPSEAAE